MTPVSASTLRAKKGRFDALEAPAHAAAALTVKRAKKSETYWLAGSKGEVTEGGGGGVALLRLMM